MVSSVIVDPFYRAAYLKGYDLGSLGYIPLSFPLSYPSVNLVSDSNSVVLFTTGGFAPFHEGHNHMLQSTISYYKSLGKSIKAVYVVVDSQEYANTKPNMITYNQRVSSVPSIYKVCDFERNLPPINFTYYFYRFQELHPCSIVAYVCGSDNKFFYPLFEDFGKLIIVERGETVNLSSKNVVVLKNSKYSAVSSTKIRSGLLYE